MLRARQVYFPFFSEEFCPLIHDRLYSFCQGRPSAIRLEELNLPRPSLDLTGPQNLVLFAFVDLSSILDEMSAILNSSPDVLVQADSLNALSEIADKLLLWLKSLPNELQPQTQSLPSPAICALHMQLLTALILMHRPFADYGVLTSRGSTLPRISSQLPGYTQAASRLICTDNSRRIAKFLQVFRQRYGIRRIFSMGGWIALTAAMSLALDLSSTPKGSNVSEGLKKALDVCVDTLQELGQSFPLARKHHSIVLSFLKFCGNPIEAAVEQSELPSFQAQPSQDATMQWQDLLVSQPMMSHTGMKPPGNQTDFDWWSWFLSQSSTIPWNGTLPFENDSFLPPISAGAIDLATTAPMDEHGWEVESADHNVGFLSPNLQTLSSAKGRPLNRVTANETPGRRIPSHVGRQTAGTVYEPVMDTSIDLASYSFPEYSEIP